MSGPPKEKGETGKTSSVSVPPITRRSSLITKVRRALRGEVTPGAVLLEAGRRAGVRLARVRERTRLARAKAEAGRARLAPEFARMSAGELLEHFRERAAPKFLAGIEEGEKSGRAQRELFPAATTRLIESADEVMRGRWPLLGYGPFEFGAQVDWLCDPVSGARWPLAYHADVCAVRGDGSDIRVVWELNRLGHLLVLARAYAVTGEERYAERVVRQLLEWRAANPCGFGPNWSCAMEAALRAMNMTAALRLVRRSRRLDAESFALILATLDEHGAHVRRNLEYSYIARGNHYLSDVAGLFWLGAALPELRRARAWRDFGWRELVRELDAQVLADGADGESSTGYHRFVAELFLYSFVIARAQGLKIEDRHWQRLRAMIEYVRAYVRPDGRAPLVGDTDGGRALPLSARAADDHAYLLALGAIVLEEPRFKTMSETPEEVLWLLGEEATRAYAALPVAAAEENESRAFKKAGTYVMRAGDAYLLLCASGAGLKGRGSHAHNDALGIEVAARGAVFIKDPGAYVYTRDLAERHRFRSTAYHSTVEVDGEEQNTTDPRTPFRLGDEARPRVLSWESDEKHDFIIAEHSGYARASLRGAGRLTHRRSVYFDKRACLWLVEDRLTGEGEHLFRFVFHLAPGTEARVVSETRVEVCDRINGARLFIDSDIESTRPALEPRWCSREYGEKTPSQAACWTTRALAPLVARWALVPVGAGERAEERRQDFRFPLSGDD